MFIAVLLIMMKKWIQPKCPPIDEWKYTMWYTYMMEYYRAIKRSVVLIHAITSMGPESIMLSEKVTKEHILHDSISVTYLK